MNDKENYPPSCRSLLASLLQIAIGLSLILFLPAGTVRWREGWLFLTLFVVACCIALFVLRKVNPEIFVARKKIHKGTKRWDLILLGFLLPAAIAILVVAALDYGRFKWSLVPFWLVVSGYVLFYVGFVLFTWAQAVNPFFEPGVRIQNDRGHHVVDIGPYAIIRHPGYVAACMLFVGAALALASFLALLPAFLSVSLIILRTILEDKTLQQELPGYKEYCQRVRFRFLPGLW